LYVVADDVKELQSLKYYQLTATKINMLLLSALFITGMQLLIVYVLLICRSTVFTARCYA